jgi:hypothetical protein
MRNPSRRKLDSILQCSPTSFIRTQAIRTVPECQESEPQNRALLARNGRTYPVTSYELGNEKSYEVGTPENALMLSDKFHLDTSDRHGSGMPRIRTAESHRIRTKRENVPWHFVLARNEKPFEMYLLSTLQCYLTSFIRTEANATPRFRRTKNPNCRIRLFRHEMGERSKPLRMTSKREILRGGWS